MTEKEFIQELEDYKKKTDLFPHVERRVQQEKERFQIIQKARKCVKNSKLVFKQETKER